MSAVQGPLHTRLCGPASHDFDLKLEQAVAVLQQAAANAPCVLASSLAAEDMVLLHLIHTHKLPIHGFTLDTGRLHVQTLEMLPRIAQRYGTVLEVFRPRMTDVDIYEQAHGRDAFYQSVELRKACCAIRKTEPLARALAGKQAWVTGLRRTQAVTRSDVRAQEWDAVHGLHKFNPLIEWTEGDVWHYIDAHSVPYNPLHDEFYPSIGCEPCTRAITPGEDVRAGRWWWENPQTKECGLHQQSALVRVSAQAHLDQEAKLSGEAAAEAQNQTKECGLHQQSALVRVSAQAHLDQEAKLSGEAAAEAKHQTEECGLHVGIERVIHVKELA
jgi:phosphoadenosine phosphosulfate reductase